jgi:DNA-binding CsgD family transcriptional regulator
LFIFFGKNTIYRPCGAVVVSINTLGIAIAVASFFVPALSIFACVFSGVGLMLGGLIMIYGLILSEKYPSRLIAPFIIFISLIGISFYSVLLEALRSNLTILYVVYLVLAVVFVIVYLLLEPYLLYSFRGRSLQEIVEAHNAAAEKETPADTEEPAAPVAVAPAESETRQKLKRVAIIPLSPREYEIAEYTIMGVKRQVICDTLDIKPGTVDSYRASVYSKIGVNNRDELLRRIEQLSRDLPDNKKS